MTQAMEFIIVNILNDVLEP